MLQRLRKPLPYMRLGTGLGILALLSVNASSVYALFNHASDRDLLVVFFQITVICGLSFAIHYLSLSTKFPSFVVAIFFGLVAQPLLNPIISHPDSMGALVGIGATMILFGGGLETPLRNFRKLFWKINSLSFIGLFLTALLLSYVTWYFGWWVGTPISVMAAILLGSALASTDPAAIIPVLKYLRFNNRETKDIIVAESALTDVTGSLLTIMFLSLLSGGVVVATIWQGYQSLFTIEALELLVKEVFFGLLFGGLGYLLLELLLRLKQRSRREYGVDAAFFIFVPMISFTAAVAFGGSGYLAAFIAGLLFSMTEKLQDTEHFFNHTVDGFMKPVIFLLLGTLVDLRSLIDYAALGIGAAFVFMFIIRPLTVWISLGPTIFFKKNGLTWREIWFISSVRETGAIPAMLLVTIVSMNIGNLEGLVAVGMWIILATLVIQPPLTPVIANWLKIGTPIKEDDEGELHLNGSDAFVVLGSRGHSHQKRLPYVIDWAARRGIGKVVLLLCLEDDYSPESFKELEAEAIKQFETINQEREAAGQVAIKFSIVGRSGFLQENIDAIASTENNVIAIFVGRKVLDYRLSEIKRLAVPLFFLD
ncbi:MAG: cation:proton antiporter [Candidatus Buchananbacteria bacterium]|nr:cation:proton antiporter [Candidatus Buchananbacteria bacterium]